MTLLHLPRLLRADFRRMLFSRWFHLAMGFMLLSTLGFISMQYSGMDYVVALDRVIFLPISFYGVATAALCSLFAGEDFSGGFIRCKLIAGRSRSAVYLSNVIVCTAASVLAYLFMLCLTLGIGVHLFENNIAPGQLLQCAVLGLFACMAQAVIFTSLTMLLQSKATSAAVCMGLAFGMLFLALHTNQIVIQEPIKNDLPNPAYVTGWRRMFWFFLHDLNPVGQAAQLSDMTVLSPVRWVVCDLIWLAVFLPGGMKLFERSDIR